MKQSMPNITLTPEHERKMLLQLIFIGIGWKRYLTYFFLFLFACTFLLLPIRDLATYLVYTHTTGEVIGYEESKPGQGTLRVSINATEEPQFAVVTFTDTDQKSHTTRSEGAFAPPMYSLGQKLTVYYPKQDPSKAKIFALPEFYKNGAFLLVTIGFFIGFRLLDLLFRLPFLLYQRVRYPHGRV